MPVVPMRPQAASAQPLPSIQPPEPTYLLMAAAQMHKEGRLVQATPDIPLPDLYQGMDSGWPNLTNTKKSIQELRERPGNEEWEPQEPYQKYDSSEPDAEDKTGDIMRKLEINQGMAKLGYKV